MMLTAIIVFHNEVGNISNIRRVQMYIFVLPIGSYPVIKEILINIGQYTAIKVFVKDVNLPKIALPLN